MPYYGKQLQNRDAVVYINRHWPNQRVKALATMRAESRLFIGAVHIYPDSEDEDLGLYQHNVSGSNKAFWKPKLWTDSKDPAVYEAIARENVRLAYEKWNSPWNRPAHLPQKRLWQPWEAYKSGWAMFPEYWVWSQAEDGIPGPWVPTGRYLHEAIRGVANWHLYINGSLNEREALELAEQLATQYGVTKGDWGFTANKGAYYVVPPKPTNPPIDGLGPRPVPNDGV